MAIFSPTSRESPDSFHIAIGELLSDLPVTEGQYNNSKIVCDASFLWLIIKNLISRQLLININIY